MRVRKGCALASAHFASLVWDRAIATELKAGGYGLGRDVSSYAPGEIQRGESYSVGDGRSCNCMA